VPIELALLKRIRSVGFELFQFLSRSDEVFFFIVEPVGVVMYFPQRKYRLSFGETPTSKLAS
jgi:hypothetical protein